MERRLMLTGQQIKIIQGSENNDSQADGSFKEGTSIPSPLKKPKRDASLVME
jgi:hypothetical protein